MILLTIVIPYYKISSFKETLDSIALQSDQRFQVFIADDASPNSPAELIKKYEGAFNFSYRRYSENLGGKQLTKQWERCMEHVDSEWFMILGDDDYLAENAVAEFYRAISERTKEKYTVLRFNRQVIGGDTNKQYEKAALPLFEKSTDYLYKRSRNEVASSLSEYVFRLKDYHEFGIVAYPSAFYSDNMMVMQYSHFSFVKTIAATVFIRITSESLSGNSANESIIEKAGWLFYRDIVEKHSIHFSTSQLSMFLNIVLNGVIKDESSMSKVQFFKLCSEKTGWITTLRKVITLVRRM